MCVWISDFEVVIEFAPLAEIPEIERLIPLLSVSWSLTRNFIFWPNVRRFLMRFGSYWFNWFVTTYSKVPVKISELLDVSCSSALYIALLIFWLFWFPKENKSNTIGWVSVSLVIEPPFDELPEVSKLISRKTGDDEDIAFIATTLASLIWTRPFPEDMLPEAMIWTGLFPKAPK